MSSPKSAISASSPDSRARLVHPLAVHEHLAREYQRLRARPARREAAVNQCYIQPLFFSIMRHYIHARLSR